MPDQLGPQLNLILAPNKETMDITINDGGTLRAGIVLSADQLSQTLTAMVQIRGQMSPEVPTKFPENPSPRVLRGTHFHFAVDGPSGELVLSLRDPGLGWLSLRFDAKLLERMLGIARAAKGKKAADGGAKH